MNDPDEETYSIFVDFGSHFPFDDFLNPDTKIKIIGLDTANPLAQVNGRFYQGDYELALGTKMFFAPSSPPDSKDWFGKRTTAEPFSYVDKTNKVLKMKRIFINKKEAEGNSSAETISEPINAKKYEIQQTYSEVLAKFLPEGQPAPREIPDEENGDHLVKKPLI